MNSFVLICSLNNNNNNDNDVYFLNTQIFLKNHGFIGYYFKYNWNEFFLCSN